MKTENVADGPDQYTSSAHQDMHFLDRGIRFAKKRLDAMTQTAAFNETNADHEALIGWLHLSLC